MVITTQGMTNEMSGCILFQNFIPCIFDVSGSYSNLFIFPILLKKTGNQANSLPIAKNIPQAICGKDKEFIMGL